MNSTRLAVFSLCLSLVLCSGILADDILNWNHSLNLTIQFNGVQPVNQANPGWSTRSMAMMNGAIYDIHQAFNRTHQPFLVDTTALPDTSLNAAVHQAAFEVLTHTYPGESWLATNDYNSRMASIPNGTAKLNGINLGHSIAQAYIQHRANDGSDVSVPYQPLPGPGKWRPDPWNPNQVAWGPAWGTVSPFAIPNTQTFLDNLPPIPALNSQEYTDAFNMVRDYGDLHSAVRTADHEAIGLFWAYDRPTMGPPPVLFLRNLLDISAQAKNSSEQNARLFAMASVAMADAAISAWDAKFIHNFWRPVTAIQEAGDGGPNDADGNPDTVGIPNWKPLGAPGNYPGEHTDDFTPPFPAWVSGHATMGGAVFKAIESFYGTNFFDEIDGIIGNNPDYVLSSAEAGSGTTRTYSTFTQLAALGIGTEDSPEGENGMSRVYLGIHWIFDQVDGTQLGNEIALYVNSNYFQPVPEPGTLAMLLLAVLGLGAVRRHS